MQMLQLTSLAKKIKENNLPFLKKTGLNFEGDTEWGTLLFFFF